MSNDLGFRLDKIEVFNFEMKQKPQDFSGSLFNFDIKADLRLSLEHKVVVVVILIDVRDETKPLVLSTLTTATGFYIDGFDENIKMNEQGIYVVPINLEIILRTISISTARGILYSNLRGTYLHRAILPVIPALVTPIPNEPATTEESKNIIKEKS